ncbi:MAG TPA: hypothetical protein VF332_08315 [Vicinamibacterales bacterium]
MTSSRSSASVAGPEHAPGERAAPAARFLVEVTTAGGSATLSSGFTYVAALPPFTDDPLTARGTVVKAAHITELRQRVDQLRARYGLAPFGWTDASLVPSRSSLPVRRSPSNHGRPASATKKGASHLQQPTLRPAATRRHACRAVRSWLTRYVRLD